MCYYRLRSDFYCWLSETNDVIQNLSGGFSSHDGSPIRYAHEIYRRYNTSYSDLMQL